MTKQGLRPSVAHNPDPTFTKAAARYEQEARREARIAAFRVFAMVRKAVNMAGYTIIGELAMRDKDGRVFRWSQGK